MADHRQASFLKATGIGYGGGGDPYYLGNIESLEGPEGTIVAGSAFVYDHLRSPDESADIISVEPPAEVLLRDSGGRIRSAASRLYGRGRIVVNTFIFGALSPKESAGAAAEDFLKRYAAFLITAHD